MKMKRNGFSPIKRNPHYQSAEADRNGGRKDMENRVKEEPGYPHNLDLLRQKDLSADFYVPC